MSPPPLRRPVPSSHSRQGRQPPNKPLQTDGWASVGAGKVRGSVRALLNAYSLGSGVTIAERMGTVWEATQARTVGPRSRRASRRSSAGAGGHVDGGLSTAGG